MISSLPMLPPFLPLLLGALAAIFLRGHLRSAVMLITPIWGALQLMALEPGIYYTMEFYRLSVGACTCRQTQYDVLATCFHLAAFYRCCFTPLHV